MSTAKPAKKGASVAKDSFRVIEVPASRVVGTQTQETLGSNDNTGDKDNEDGEDKDGGEDNGDGIDDENGSTIDVDASGLVANMNGVIAPGRGASGSINRGSEDD
ncbi:hypothetical protein C0995_012230 [Termitomyces sp. Mi166|nr:hypothetical protein C0995_012230 [Termitomyces sp. Mi166\